MKQKESTRGERERERERGVWYAYELASVVLLWNIYKSTHTQIGMGMQENDAVNYYQLSREHTVAWLLSIQYIVYSNKYNTMACTIYAHCDISQRRMNIPLSSYIWYENWIYKKTTERPSLYSIWQYYTENENSIAEYIGLNTIYSNWLINNNL